MSLLKEISDLRRELKLSRTLAHDLEAAIKIARKNGFDDQNVLSNIRASPPASGLGKTEPVDQSRLIDLQKFEINRLREKIQELEGLKRPGDTKLPPLQQPLAIQ